MFTYLASYSPTHSNKAFTIAVIPFAHSTARVIVGTLTHTMEGSGVLPLVGVRRLVCKKDRSQRSRRVGVRACRQPGCMVVILTVGDEWVRITGPGEGVIAWVLFLPRRCICTITRVIKLSQNCATKLSVFFVSSPMNSLFTDPAAWIMTRTIYTLQRGFWLLITALPSRPCMAQLDMVNLVPR